MRARSRSSAIGSLQKVRGTRVVAMIHRQETVGVLGVPFYRFIDIDDSEAVLRAIRLTPSETRIDLLLHTPGGLVLASEQIAYALRDHPGKVTVLVPHYAMSGGTLLALAADEILMDPSAVLGPVDPQLGDTPAAALVRVVEKKPIERLDDRFPACRRGRTGDVCDDGAAFSQQGIDSWRDVDRTDRIEAGQAAEVQKWIVV